MNGDTDNTLGPLLEALLSLPAAQREAELQRRCAGNAGLLQKARGALAVQARAQSHFESLARDIARRADAELDAAARPSIRIGPYRTCELIGRGGMGVVYRALRVDGEFEQEVAIKLLHLDMDTPELRSRFLAERQLLAGLAHEHIARLLDGGLTEEGRPYFVMEFVRGVPIETYCRRARPDMEALLRLVLLVIDAVSYLHRNLVVHRDLKPGNILVDDDGRPKLVDFGIAKLLSAAPDAAARTRTGLALMTPDYAAPEQLRGDPITTATDVYALGIILYELLCGQHPFGHSRHPRMPDAEPRAPSQRRSRTHPLRPDQELDRICLMALRTEPEQRYASAAQLGEDLERYLRGEPLIAGGRALGYRAAKFLRRNLHYVLPALLVVCFALLGFARERGLRGAAETARAQAQLEAARAGATSEFLTGLLASIEPSRAKGQEIAVADVLEQALLRLQDDTALRQQPSVEATLRATIGESYRQLGRLDQARPQLQQALELWGEAARVQPEYLDVLESLAIIDYLQDENEKAEASLRDIHRIRSQTLGASHPDTLATATRLATAIWRQGRYEDSERLDRAILAMRESSQGPSHPDTLRTLNGIGVSLYSLGRFDEAAGMFARALEGLRPVLGAHDPAVLQIQHNLATVYDELGRLDEAEALLQGLVEARMQVMGVNDGDTHMSMQLLAAHLLRRERLAEAEAWLMRSWELGRGIVRTRSMLLLARVHLEQGRLEEAGTQLHEAMRRLETDTGRQVPDELRAYNALGELHLRKGDLPAAEQAVHAALAVAGSTAEPGHPLVLESRLRLARIRNEQHAFAEAESQSRSVLDLAEASLASDHSLILDARRELVRALLGQRRPLVAIPRALNLLAASRRGWGEDHRRTQDALDLLSRSYQLAGNHEQAEHYRRLLLAGSEGDGRESPGH